jgi:hexokinase
VHWDDHVTHAMFFDGVRGEALVREGIVDLAGRERAGRIEIAYVKDSTSAGAAVIAAVAATHRSE